MKICFVSSFTYHIECLGFLLDIFTDYDNEIDVFISGDRYMYAEYFAKIYKFNLYYNLDFDTKKYDYIVVLSADDYLKKLSVSKNLIAILHKYNFNNYKNCKYYFTFAKNNILHNNVIKLLPLYHGIITKNMSEKFYKKTILYVGEFNCNQFDDDLINFVSKSMYNFIFIVRFNDYINVVEKVKNINLTNINILTSISTSDLLDYINAATFVLIRKNIHMKFIMSGAINLSLSHNTPIIIQKNNNVIDNDNNNCLFFDVNYSELINKLNYLQYEDYKNLYDKMIETSDIVRMQNKLNINNILKNSSYNNKHYNDYQYYNHNMKNIQLKKQMQKQKQLQIQNKLQVHKQKITQNRLQLLQKQKNIQRNTQRNIQKNIQKNVQRNVQKHVQRNLQRNVQKNVQRNVQRNIVKYNLNYFMKNKNIPIYASKFLSNDKNNEHINIPLPRTKQMDINIKINKLLCFIPIYCINLLKSIDRKNYMTNLFNKYMIDKYKFIVAIDGNNDVNEILDKRIYSHTTQKYMSRKEIAVTLSHLNAIRNAYNDNCEYALVLEDDCDFSFLQYCEHNILDLFNNEREIIQLGHCAEFKENNKLKNNNNVVINKTLYGAFAYIVNRKGMKKILDKYEIFGDDALDNADFYIYTGIKSCMVTKPCILYNFNLNSTIRNKHEHLSLHAESKLFWIKYYSNK